jgi:hypothetical protein
MIQVKRLKRIISFVNPISGQEHFLIVPSQYISFL